MRRIQEILKQWKEESQAKGVLQFKYSYSTGTLTLYTPYCGWFIGRAGVIVDKYRDLLKSEITGFKDIKFIETEYEAII